MSIWKDDLNNRKKNIRSLLSDPKTRPIIFITSGLIVGMVIVGYMSLTSAASDPALEASANIGARNVEVQADPSARSSTAHARLQEEANRKALADAQAAQRSSLPSLVGTTGLSDPLTLPNLPSGNEGDSMPAPIVQLPQATPPVYAPQIPQAPPPMMAPPAPSAPVVQAKAAEHVADQVAGYLGLWGPGEKQLQEFEFARTSKPGEDGAGVGGSMGGSSGGSNGYSQNQQPAPVLASNSSPQSEIRFVRAGTVVPARMMTPLNSDNPGPVLAEVSSGPLKGARLLGTMAVQKEGILVTFTSINKPGWPDTYSVSAVGMSNDGYTGMATDVNHHYLKRYTALLGGAFLSGYGEGLGDQGSTTIITDGGAVVNTQDELDMRQIRNKGYGEVATTIGSEIRAGADRDTTIEIKGKKGQMYDFQVLFLRNF